MAFLTLCPSKDMLEVLDKTRPSRHDGNGYYSMNVEGLMNDVDLYDLAADLFDLGYFAERQADWSFDFYYCSSAAGRNSNFCFCYFSLQLQLQ